MGAKSSAWLTENFGLAGKRALVTGASKGIGGTIAIALARAGANLTLWGRDTASLESTVSVCIEAGAEVSTVIADMRDPKSISLAAEKAIVENQIDILINNAGTISRAPAIETKSADWQSVIDINVNAIFTITQIVAKPMLERRDGRIINIASLLSFQGGINVPAYTASKHAVVGLTKALANEWASLGVTVNAIAPGYIATDNTKPLMEDAGRQKAILARIPMGRWGIPEDIAGSVIFLSSEAASYVTGHVLVVDGGWLSR